MHELLREYISEKEKVQREKLEEQKKAFLISEELYEKEYSEKDVYDAEYPYGEWDAEKQRSKYFKKIPIEITDSKYEQLLELRKSTNTKTQDVNTVATLLTIIAWIIFIGGFIIGIILGNVEVGTYYSHTEFSFAVALVYWGVSFISGIFILGFAEIIKLLNDIKNK